MSLPYLDYTTIAAPVHEFLTLFEGLNRDRRDVSAYTYRWLGDALPRSVQSLRQASCRDLAVTVLPLNGLLGVPSIMSFK